MSATIDPLLVLYFDLGRNLTSQEVRKIKNLVSDKIGRRDLERLADATDIFLKLQDMCVIKREDLGYLKEVFYLIGAIPLVRKIDEWERRSEPKPGTYGERTFRSQENFQNGHGHVTGASWYSHSSYDSNNGHGRHQISPLSRLYDTLNDSIGRDDERTIRFILNDYLSSNELNELDDFAAILKCLEEKKIIKENDLGLVKELLKLIDRRPLIELVEKYEKDWKVKGAINDAQENPSSNGNGISQLHRSPRYTPHAAANDRHQLALWRLFETLNNSITREDERSVRLILKDYIPNRQLTELEDFAAILRWLEDKNFITENDLRLVKEVLELINRRPLIEIVQKYEKAR